MGSDSPKDTGEGEATSTRAAGTTILVVAAAAVIVVIAVAAVISASRGSADLEHGSPEAAVQAYLDAVIDGDEATAYAFFSAELQEECSIRDLRNERERSRDVRVVLRTVRADGDDAEVEVTIVEDPGGGLFGDGYRYEEEFILVRSGNAWLIVEQPWPIFFCES